MGDIIKIKDSRIAGGIVINDFAVPGITLNNGKPQSEFVNILNLNDNLIARQLSEMKQIKLDLIMARDLFVNVDRLEDAEANYVIKYAFWFAGSMTYCRCFNSGRGRNRKLSDKHIKRANSTLQQIHDELILLRNKYLAHADKNDFEHYSVFGILDYERQEILGLSSLFDRTIVPSNDFLQKAIELIENLISQVAEEEDIIADKLVAHLSQAALNENDIIKPTNPQLPENAAQLYGLYSKLMFEKGDYQESLKYITFAIEAVSGIWENHHNRAQIYRILGQIELAEADDRMAIKLRA